MAFDSTFKLVDAALDHNSQSTQYPNANLNGFQTTALAAGHGINLGRRGLPKGAQFVTIVEGLADAGGATALAINLMLSLDNGTTWKRIATHDWGDPTVPFNGERVSDIAQDFRSQEYANANIDVALQVVMGGANASQNISATKLAAFIAVGESQKFGRRGTADTLFT